MKRTAIISLLAFMLLALTSTALAQEVPKRKPQARSDTFGPPTQKCPFDIIGTWQAQISTTEARLYTFDAEGVVKVFAVSGTQKPMEIATARYELPEDPNAPRQVSFTATGENKIFGRAKATMDVASFDDSSITCVIPGVAGTTRWTRVDPNRYFVIFVARRGEFHDNSGSSFPMLIRLSEGVSKIDAAGIYAVQGQPVFGAVPPENYKDYLREARADSEVILRLEITSRQYERALKIVQEWQRRAREGALLYKTPESPLALNNVLLVRSVSETLNICQNDVDVYKLDYTYPTDWISEQFGPEFIPFFFFKELRRRNEARHIEYKKFQELVPLPNVASR